MIADLPWGTRKVSDLVTGSHVEEDGLGHHFLVEGFSWYEARCKAYDMGVPEMALDAIQLDMAIEQIEDLPMKAAIQLRALGWDHLDIAVVIKDRKHRPASQLVEDGIEKVRKLERERKASGEG